jgi:hypothetical protein
MPGALAVLPKVREGPVKAGVAYSHVRGCIRILEYPEEIMKKKAKAKGIVACGY